MANVLITGMGQALDALNAAHAAVQAQIAANMGGH
jgi:hypothetical protein